MTVHAQQLYSAAQVHLREAERLRRKSILFALSWFPFFTNLNSLRFVEKQMRVMELVLDQDLAWGDRES